MKADFKVAINVPFAAKPQQGKPQAKKPNPAAAPASPPPRIATLMALAIHMDQLLHDGYVKDQAELAKLAGVTRARVTQVMNLLWLTPDIQEQLLFLEEAGPVERELRKLLTNADWEPQRRVRGNQLVE